jgi:hypothetical protein
LRKQNQLFVRDLTTTTLTEANTWEEVKPADQANRPPVKRYGHSAVVRDDEMWVFGGFDSDSWTCSDLWSFHFGTRHLSPLGVSALMRKACGTHTRVAVRVYSEQGVEAIRVQEEQAGTRTAVPTLSGVQQGTRPHVRVRRPGRQERRHGRPVEL